jgi:hypothetical protein
MSLVDLIEELGAAVDAGLIRRSTAVRLIVEDGGFTQTRAADVLGTWTTVRERAGEDLGAVAGDA